MDITHKTIPLPIHAYVPGKNQRHAEGFLDHVTDSAPKITSNVNANQNIAWLYGLKLLENGYYWECHEVLETVWMNALPNSREKHLVQGIIHLANSALKFEMKRPLAANKLKVLASKSFTEAYSGIGSQVLLLLSHIELEDALRKLISQQKCIKFMNYSALIEKISNKL